MQLRINARALRKVYFYDYFLHLPVRFLHFALISDTQGKGRYYEKREEISSFQRPVVSIIIHEFAGFVN